VTISEAPSTTGTATQILDVAERLLQTRGYNAFSYADIATELSVSKAALHYHFRSKGALGDVLVERYSERFFDALDAIPAGAPAPEKLARYVDLYRGVLQADRLCMCGILAAEYQTLPMAMRDAVLAFFDRNETWLEGVLRDGIAGGTIRASEPVRDSARVLISGLEGAMMLARARHDYERFDCLAERMLRDLTA
jgi:TetR/AcrR family transcriptional regulator, transcriptional repressor for nem operon